MTAGTTRADTRYRLSLAHVLRLVAPFVIGVGVLWVLFSLVGALDVVGIAWGAVTVLVALVALGLSLRPPVVLTLSAEGYRVGFARGSGQRTAPWRDVEDVATQPVHGTACLVMSLPDARSSVVPLSLLGARAVEAQREVHERLNTAYGYRRLEP